MRTAHRLTLASLALIAVATTAPATPSSPPRINTYVSNNFRVELWVVPSQRKIKVFDAPAPRRIDAQGEKWSIARPENIDDCLVTDDGELVITFFARGIHARSPEGKIGVLDFYTRQGLIKQHQLADLVQDEKLRVKVGSPTGFFALHHWYRNRRIVNDELLVTTIDNLDLRFSLTTGDLTPADAPGPNRSLIFWGRAWPWCLLVVMIAIGLVSGAWLIFGARLTAASKTPRPQQPTDAIQATPPPNRAR